MIDFSISVIESMESWQDLAEEWPSLLQSSASGSFFLTWEWLTAWAECCLGGERSLFVLALHEKGRLAGVAPFYIHRKKYGPFTVRELRFLGSPDAGSDYLDVVSRRGRENAIADAIYDFLMGEAKKEWDILYLQDVPADALFIVNLMKRVQADGKYAEIAQSAYCPVVDLPPTDVEMLAQLSPWRRKKFKQDFRVIHRESDVVHSVFQGDEVAAGLDDFFHLYEEKGGWPGQRHRILFRTYLEKCRGDKPLQLDLLSVGGRNVAGLLHVKYQRSLAMYLMAVDKSFNPKLSLGNLLVGMCLKNSIAAGYGTYDFLKGDEGYKFHWATGGKTSVQLIFWQKTPIALFFGLNRLLRHAGKLVLR